MDGSLSPPGRKYLKAGLTAEGGQWRVLLQAGARAAGPANSGGEAGGSGDGLAGSLPDLRPSRPAPGPIFDLRVGTADQIERERCASWRPACGSRVARRAGADL